MHMGTDGGGVRNLHKLLLGLRWLGLAPVTGRRSRVTDRVTGPASGRSGYPEGCAAARATGNGSDSRRALNFYLFIPAP